MNPIIFTGQILNNLSEYLYYISCHPRNIEVETIYPNTIRNFIVTGNDFVIGSCLFYVLNSTLEILCNIQPQFNHEHYGITHSQYYNSTVLISESHNAHYYLW